MIALRNGTASPIAQAGRPFILRIWTCAGGRQAAGDSAWHGGNYYLMKIYIMLSSLIATDRNYGTKPRGRQGGYTYACSGTTYSGL